MSAGFLYAFGAFLCIGSYLIPVRFSSSKGLAFFPLMGLGLAGTELFLWGSLRELSSHPLWLLAGIVSGLLWGCGQVFAYLTLEEISFSKASVLYNLNSVVNIALGLLLFKEATGPGALAHILLGAGLILIGTGWVSRIQAAPAKERNLKKGIFFGLAAGIFWGLYFVPMRAIQLWNGAGNLPISSLLSGLILGGCLLALALGLSSGKTRWSLPNIGWGFATSLLWALGTFFFLSANQSLGLARAVPLVNSNALIYAAWSLLVFKELPSRQWPKVLGGTLMVAGGTAILVGA